MGLYTFYNLKNHVLNNKTNNPIQQLATTHMKRCATSLIITEMHVKLTMSYGFIPSKLAHIVYMSKPGNSKCWQEGGEIRALGLC